MSGGSRSVSRVPSLQRINSLQRVCSDDTFDHASASTRITWLLLPVHTMLLTLPIDCQQVPSGVLNRGEAAALAGGLQRMPSGNIYDGFPCIRVGDFVLPSSMDLRAPFC